MNAVANPVQYLPTAKLRHHERNPRFIKDPDFEKLCASIAAHPDYFETRPILCNPDKVVFAGNMRLRAAKHLGLKQVPCVVMDIPEERQAELMIRDNVSNGQWDADTLAADFEMDQLLDWGVPDFVFGGSGEDEAEVLEAQEDEYDVPEVNTVQTDIVLGDLIEIGRHRLLCGSSTEADAVAKLMDGKKADMVFTDPPYGVNYTGGVIHGNKINENHKRDKLENDDVDIYGDFIALLPLVIDNGALYIFYATRNSYEIFKALKENDIPVMAVLAWIKVNTGYADMNSHYKNRYEPCVYCKVGDRTNFVGATNENTTWEIEKDRVNKLHPTQKPIDVPFRAIKNHSAKIVADLFGGSGSTMVAAHQLNRTCYGMELDPKYCQVIIDRMAKLDPSLSVTINGKPYVKSSDKAATHA